MKLTDLTILDLHVEHDDLARKNHELVEAFREKSRKHIQTQELYDRLKRKALMTDVQTAASESVDHVLQSASGQRYTDRGGDARTNQPYQAASQAQRQRQYPQFLVDHNGIERLQHHQRDGSHGSGGGGNMGPPPPRFSAGYGGLGSTLREARIYPLRSQDLTIWVVNGISGTPSQYRTRLPTPARMGRPSDRLQTLNPRSGLAGNPQAHTSFLPRQPLNSFSPNKSNSSLSGYGMSAGMKVGRQQRAGIGDLDPHGARF